MSFLDDFLKGATGPTGPTGPAGSIGASWQNDGSTIALGATGTTETPSASASLQTTSGGTETWWTVNCPEGYAAIVNHTGYANVTAGSGATGLCAWKGTSLLFNPSGAVEQFPGAITMTPTDGVYWKADACSGAFGPASMSFGTASGAAMPVQVTGIAATTIEWSVWVDVQIFPLA